MEDCMRKLALWQTKTFNPIMTHVELEPIMTTLGFVGLPPSSSSWPWKEYAYMAKPPNYKQYYDHSEEQPPVPPQPKLPYPKIDGLHLYTYQAFIDSVNFYLEISDISDLFHVRGMPLSRNVDRNWKWRRMNEEENVFVYREGTLDQTTYHLYHLNKPSSGDGDDSALIRDKGKTAPISCIVPLKDIIVVV
ncbi:cellulose synthase protein [Salix suchowensis]|nr:cellulose synthase protein [Salix suchowensis]